MLRNEFQGGNYFEVLNPPAGGKSVALNEKWQMKGFAKEYDSVVRGFVFSSNKSICKASFPALQSSGRVLASSSAGHARKACLVQPVLILQLYISGGSQNPFQLELGVTDTTPGSSTFRIHLSTAVRELKKTVLHALVPIPPSELVYNQWMTLCVNLLEITRFLFPSKTYRSLDSISINGAFSLRRVFTVKKVPLDYERLCEALPHSFLLSSDVFCQINFASICRAQQSVSARDEQVPLTTKSVQRTANVAFGKHVDLKQAPANLVQSRKATHAVEKTGSAAALAVQPVSKPMEKKDSKVSLSSNEGVSLTEETVLSNKRSLSNVPQSKIPRIKTAPSIRATLPSVGTGASSLADEAKQSLFASAPVEPCDTVLTSSFSSNSFKDTSEHDHEDYSATESNSESELHCERQDELVSASVADLDRFSACSSPHTTSDARSIRSIRSIRSNDGCTQSLSGKVNDEAKTLDERPVASDTAAVLSKLLESVNKLQLASEEAAREGERYSPTAPRSGLYGNSSLAKSLEQLYKLSVKYKVVSRPVSESSRKADTDPDSNPETGSSSPTQHHINVSKDNFCLQGDGAVSLADERSLPNALESRSRSSICESQAANGESEFLHNKLDAKETCQSAPSPPRFAEDKVEVEATAKVGVELIAESLHTIAPPVSTLSQTASTEEDRGHWATSPSSDGASKGDRATDGIVEESDGDEDELVDLEYDKERECYFDPTTGKYYTITP